MSSTPTTTIIRLPPPGPSVLAAQIPPSLSSTSSNIPLLFLHALQVRTIVFVDEQHVPASNEIDSDDPRSWHWVCFTNDEDEGVAQKNPIATIRLVHPGREHSAPVEGSSVEEPDYASSIMWDGQEPYIKIGRLATIKSHRGQGLAQHLIYTALEWACRNPGEFNGNGGERWKGLVLGHVQIQLEGWYGKLGFRRDEGLGVWLEDGIQHVGMWRRVDVEKGGC